MERRQPHRRGSGEGNNRHTRRWIRLETELARIAQIARERPKEQFTSLAHLLNQQMLAECHEELKRRKAPGVDGVTWEEYNEELEANICSLHSRLKEKRYVPQPVRRTYIPKPGSDQMRPLGIPAYEDKIVQLAVSKILTAIYEQDFLNVSYGFRPKRGCHDALKAVDNMIMFKKVNWVVDADIKGFFDHVDHGWMMRCLEVRIKDPSLLRIIGRILKAGYMEEGVTVATDEGTPQGGVISPILANVYLHYVLDLWFEKAIKPRLRGEAYIVRYADDFICCFQYEDEARGFYRQLQARLGKFNLEISAEKSKIIEFGRFARENMKKKGLGKPETFDFLGLTHYCSTSRNGKFRVKRKTSKKKYRTALSKIKVWLKHNRNMPIMQIHKALSLKLLGHYRYYGITDNSKISNFGYEVVQLFFKWINRRSQRRSYTWEQFLMFLSKNPLPTPKIYVSVFENSTPIV
jgi:RNA-directed DNA polymerase